MVNYPNKNCTTYKNILALQPKQGLVVPSSVAYRLKIIDLKSYITRTHYSIFKQNNRIEIHFFVYEMQSIVFIQTAVAHLSHNKNTC